MTPAGDTALWIDLDTLLGTDVAGVADDPSKVSYVGLGSLKISADKSELYVVNLYTQEIYIIPIGSDGSPPTQASEIKRFPTPTPADCTGTYGELIGPDLYRPHKAVLGLGLHPLTDEVYVSITCTGPTTDDMYGQIYSFDPQDTTPDVADFVLQIDTIDINSIQPTFANQATGISPWTGGGRSKLAG